MLSSSETASIFDAQLIAGHVGFLSNLQAECLGTADSEVFLTNS